MLSERTIINGLLLLGGMLLGPYLIVAWLEMNETAFLSFVALVFLFCVFFFVKDRIAFFPFIGAYFSGAINALGGFTLVELSSFVVFFYYVINYVILKRRSITAGPIYFLIPILIIGAIVLYHDSKLGLRALGSSEQGSRPGILILIAIVVYFCGINIPTPSLTFLRRVPFYCFITALFSSIPFLLTTFYPSLAPSVYNILGNVNVDAYKDSITGAEESDLARMGIYAQLGGSLQLALMCYWPINTWWHPKRWILIIISIVCFGAVLWAGYRNTLFGFLLSTFFATVAYARWRILFLLPLLVLLPLAVVIVQNDHPEGLKVAPAVQRSMSFITAGHWDPDVIASAESSNDFRADIKRVYVNEYLYKSPWIGNGFTFDAGEYEGLSTLSEAPGVTDHQYYQTKAFIISKNFHIGWISLYDAVGIIGGMAFVMLYLYVLWMVALLVFQKDENSHSRVFPLKVFLFANLFTGAIGYFTTFGSFWQSLVGMCGSAIILVHLRQIQNQQTSVTVSPSPQTPLVPPREQVFSPLNIPSN